jgi:hypothetical protein
LIWLKAGRALRCHHQRVTTRAAAMILPPTTRPVPSWRALLLPREHGSWSLALEPLALGLIAAPSWPGAALALGAVALFFARRPWQAARAGDVRMRSAMIALIALGIVASTGFASGLSQAPGTIGVALLVGVPAGVAFAWFDRRKAGREIAAELCGAAFFAVFPAAMVLAAGRDAGLAAAIAGFALARSWTSILAIRAFLRRRKGAVVESWPSVVAAVAAVVAFGLYANHTGCWIPAAWAGVFLFRATSLLGRRTPAWTARQLGTMEAILGVLVTVTSGLAFP